MVAVKPHVVPIALSEIKPLVKQNHLILSVAMGVTVQDLEKVRLKKLNVNNRII